MRNFLASGLLAALGAAAIRQDNVSREGLLRGRYDGYVRTEKSSRYSCQELRDLRAKRGVGPVRKIKREAT